MLPELINLLPEPRKRSLRRLYFMRLVVVATVLAAAVMVVHGVLLLPSYLHLRGVVEERTDTLASMQATLAGSEEQELSARIEALRNDATRLGRLSTLPKASAGIAAVLKVPREGIRLSGFSFAPGKDGASMTVSGVASTREALRSYEQALANEPYIASSDLPISAYAKESDIAFSILLSGPFLP